MECRRKNKFHLQYNKIQLDEEFIFWLQLEKKKQHKDKDKNKSYFYHIIFNRKFIFDDEWNVNHLRDSEVFLYLGIIYTI